MPPRLPRDGDATTRTSAVDIARQLPWPSRFTARVLRDQFTDNWDGREVEVQQVAGSVGQQWVDGYATGDTDCASPFIGDRPDRRDRASRSRRQANRALRPPTFAVRPDDDLKSPGNVIACRPSSSNRSIRCHRSGRPPTRRAEHVEPIPDRQRYAWRHPSSRSRAETRFRPATRISTDAGKRPPLRGNSHPSSIAFAFLTRRIA
jgi:hypothetical protein